MINAFGEHHRANSIVLPSGGQSKYSCYLDGKLSLRAGLPELDGEPIRADTFQSIARKSSPL
jgi:hypothetical protein